MDRVALGSKLGPLGSGQVVGRARRRRHGEGEDGLTALHSAASGATWKWSSGWSSTAPTSRRRAMMDRPFCTRQRTGATWKWSSGWSSTAPTSRRRTNDGVDRVALGSRRGPFGSGQMVGRARRRRQGEGQVWMDSVALGIDGGHLEVVKWLVEHGADVTAKDNNGWTVLHWAASCGHLEVVKWLIEHGADVTAKDKDGWTVLHSAAFGGHLEVVKWLVEHGADVTAKDDEDGLFCIGSNGATWKRSSGWSSTAPTSPRSAVMD